MICASCRSAVTAVCCHPRLGTLCHPCAAALPDADLPDTIPDARLYVRAILAQAEARKRVEEAQRFEDANRRRTMGAWLSLDDLRRVA